MRGRANKVTKPKRSSRTPSVAPEAVSQGVDYLAAAAHAQQHLADHHHNHHDPHDQLHEHEQHEHEHEHDDGEDEGDEDEQQNQQQQEQDFYQASNAVEQHQRQQLGLEPAEVVAGTADPSIHPDLQAFGSAAHAHFSLGGHQDMDAQMQDASVNDPASVAAAAAAAVGSASKPVAGLSTAADFARESGYENLDLDQTASTLSRRLMSQPGRRLALQRRKEQKLNLVRRSNVEALLAHVSGQQAASACKNCHKGHGPWTSCVVVDGQMCGSCANCWYNASGARCSFHGPPTRRPPPSAAPQPNAFGLPHLAPANSTIQLPPGVLAHDPQLASLTYDSEAKLVMDRAMAAAREATTRKARHLLKVEVAAKQLVLSMLEYEEYAQSEAAASLQQQQQQHSHAQQQQARLSHAQAQAHAQSAVRQVSESGQAVPDAAMGPGEEDDGT